MLARSIISSALLLAGSALGQGDQPVTETVTAASTSFPVFTSVVDSTSYTFSVTDGVATATTDAGAFTSTAAPVYASVAITSSVAPAYTSVACQCVCSAAPFIGDPIQSLPPIVNGSDPYTDGAAFTSSPAFTDSSVFTSDSPAFTTPAAASSATWTPCDDDSTSQVDSQATQSSFDPTTQTVSQTTQSDITSTTQSVGTGTQNQVLNANSAVKEIGSIQWTAVFTLIGLVGAGVTFL